MEVSVFFFFFFSLFLSFPFLLLPSGKTEKKIYIYTYKNPGSNPVNCRQEGVHSFYKGITPRIMRVAPGQAVTFTVYEFLKSKLEKHKPYTLYAGRYEE